MFLSRHVKINENNAYIYYRHIITLYCSVVLLHYFENINCTYYCRYYINTKISI